MTLPMSKTTVSSVSAGFHLVEDLLIEILSRLPVKSLVRFTVVCKAWQALVENRNFTLKHLKQNPNLNFSYLRYAYFEHETRQSPDGYSCDYALSLHYENAPETPINLDFPFLDEGRNLCIIGVCNGLVCISLDLHQYDLVICNPSTRRFTIIPSFDALEAECFRNREAAYGFAFDPSSNDYKVLSISCYIDTERKLRDKTGVYTMSTGSWRQIDIDVPIDDLRVRQHLTAVQILIGNMFYWGCERYSSDDPVLLSFNMVDESFSVILGPEDFHGAGTHARWKSVQLKEEVAIFAFTSDRCFVVWTLNADLVSWKLKYVIGTMPVVAMPLGLDEVGVITLVGCGKNGDVIYEDCTSSDTKLFSYDFDSGEINSLPFVEIGYTCQVHGYTESLISVKKNDQV